MGVWFNKLPCTESWTREQSSHTPSQSPPLPSSLSQAQLLLLSLYPTMSLHRQSQFLPLSFCSGCLWWASLVSCFFRFLLRWSCLLICLITFICRMKTHSFIFQGRNVSSVVCCYAGALPVFEVPQRLPSYRQSRIALFLCGAGEFLRTLAIQS